MFENENSNIFWLGLRVRKTLDPDPNSWNLDPQRCNSSRSVEQNKLNNAEVVSTWREMFQHRRHLLALSWVQVCGSQLGKLRIRIQPRLLYQL